MAAFDLTFDDNVGVWFMTLLNDLLHDFVYIKEEFLTNFAMWGTKWNDLTQARGERKGTWLLGVQKAYALMWTWYNISNKKLMEWVIRELYDSTLQKKT